ncbi:hypothetical protein N8T08_008814 [Aspergillus melleus]|uniref:Uncharacterized protein n=1 Tax=Aspergillus melleus TaxID=138277 RepID=A0ACC3AV43_9EURO|nr:hypothetical protein N8T08_008814 [Aspergillus melleus]
MTFDEPSSIRDGDDDDPATATPASVPSPPQDLAQSPFLDTMMESIRINSSNRDVLPGMLPNNIGTSVGGACWVADCENHNKLSPVSCVGELLVEGYTLAGEYFNNTEKTEAAFILQPSWLPCY